MSSLRRQMISPGGACHRSIVESRVVEGSLVAEDRDTIVIAPEVLEGRSDFARVVDDEDLEVGVARKGEEAVDAALQECAVPWSG